MDCAYARKIEIEVENLPERQRDDKIAVLVNRYVNGSKFGKGSMDETELLEHYMTTKNKERGQILKQMVEEMKKVKEVITKENENLKSDVIDKEARREIAKE